MDGSKDTGLEAILEQIEHGADMANIFARVFELAMRSQLSAERIDFS